MIDCRFEHGRRANPGLRHVGTGVVFVRGNQVLLVKRAEGLLEAGKWCLPGGFLDRDETAVEGARRELMEEAGWEAGELTLLRINDKPERPGEDRQNVDLVFFGEAVKQVGEPDAETAELRWFDLDGLPPDNQIAFDHGDSLKMYRDFSAKPFRLPVM